MGEVSEMMLDGTLCSSCGAYLGDGDGYPQQCGSCKHENQPKKRARKACEPREKVTCQTCKKRVNAVGLKDHMRDAHGVKA